MAGSGVTLHFTTPPTSKKGQVDAGEKRLEVKDLKVTPGVGKDGLWTVSGANGEKKLSISLKAGQQMAIDGTTFEVKLLKGDIYHASDNPYCLVATGEKTMVMGPGGTWEEPKSPPAKPRGSGYGENDSFKDSQPKKDWSPYSGSSKLPVDSKILAATNRMFEKQLLEDIDQSFLDLSNPDLDANARRDCLDGLSKQLDRLVGPLADQLGVQFDQTGRKLQMGSSVQLDEDQQKKLEAVVLDSAKRFKVKIQGFEYYSGSAESPLRYVPGPAQPAEASKFKRFISG